MVDNLALYVKVSSETRQSVTWQEHALGPQLRGSTIAPRRLAALLSMTYEGRGRSSCHGPFITVLGAAVSKGSVQDVEMLCNMGVCLHRGSRSWQGVCLSSVLQHSPNAALHDLLLAAGACPYFEYHYPRAFMRPFFKDEEDLRWDRWHLRWAKQTWLTAFYA
jgi:hypothetical protein